MSDYSRDEEIAIPGWGYVVNVGLQILQEEYKKNPRSKKGLMTNERMRKNKLYYSRMFQRLGALADAINSPEDKDLWKSALNPSEWEEKVWKDLNMDEIE